MTESISVVGKLFLLSNVKMSDFWLDKNSWHDAFGDTTCSFLQLLWTAYEICVWLNMCELELLLLKDWWLKGVYRSREF